MMNNKYIFIDDLTEILKISKDTIINIIQDNNLNDYLVFDNDKPYIREDFKNIYKNFLEKENTNNKNIDVIEELKRQLVEKDNTIKELQKQIVEFANNAQKIAEMTLQSQMQMNYIKTLEAPKPQGIFKRLFGKKEKTDEL